ncbi:MAG: hypothetical protein GY729_13615 [Desulfobacteraceae bacterium]|nr:hypothetical protein [Desulfobacteraceae bacterium]
MTKNTKEDTSAIQILEEAFHLLKTIPVETYIPYYFGTMPFLVGLLYFWNDMSKNAFAHEYCLTASLGLALLFIWMKTWQSVFSIKLYEAVSRHKIHSRSFAGVLKMVLTQTVIHSSSIIVLPAALIITIPFAWTFAVYQMALVHDFSMGTDIQTPVKTNFQAARHFTLLNHFVIFILFIFGLFVFLNIGITIYLMPFLAKSLFGLDSLVTMGGFNIFNSTFILSVICLTHLCVDPLVKAVFVLQKFYYQSGKTGEDLIAGLSTIKALSKKAAVLLVLATCLFLPEQGLAAESSKPVLKKKAMTIDAKNLEKSISHVMGQREYTWRMPREEIQKKNDKNGFIYAVLKWSVSWIKKIYKSIESWAEGFFKWIEKIFPKDSKPEKPKESKSFIKPTHLAAGLIVLTAILFVIIILHIRKFKQKKVLETKDGPKAIPDISNENTLADELSSDKWDQLASDLLEKGELRLALRALFLGTLAFLSDEKLITIARYKSNSEYKLELHRRAHTKQNLLHDFIETVKTIDRVWYGMHGVNRQLFDEFAGIQKRIISFAK